MFCFLEGILSLNPSRLFGGEMSLRMFDPKKVV